MKKILSKIAITVMAIVGTMEVSADTYDTIGEAKKLIVQFEGFSETVYRCSAGTLSIGYGFTNRNLVRRGRITRAEADRVLDKRVRDEAIWVQKTFPKLSARQRVAIISLAYNVGHGTLCWRTVNGKRVRTNTYNALVKGDWITASARIRRFRLCDGVVSKGLVRRREAELEYFM